MSSLDSVLQLLAWIVYRFLGGVILFIPGTEALQV